LLLLFQETEPEQEQQEQQQHELPAGANARPVVGADAGRTTRTTIGIHRELMTRIIIRRSDRDARRISIVRRCPLDLQRQPRHPQARRPHQQQRRPQQQLSS
jgi:hypothetical protein